jgi:hypothetical protein
MEICKIDPWRRLGSRRFDSRRFGSRRFVDQSAGVGGPVFSHGGRNVRLVLHEGLGEQLELEEGQLEPVGVELGLQERRRLVKSTMQIAFGRLLLVLANCFLKL